MSKSKYKTPKSAAKSKSKRISCGEDQQVAAPAIVKRLSRRDLLAGAAIGSVTAAALGFPVLTGRKAMEAMAAPPPPQTGPGQGNQSIVLKNCLAVLTMDDPKNDLQGADIVVQNGKIAAIGKGLGGATGNRVVDCSTCIAMPGFITTHHHKYETPQRSANADGYIVFAGDPEQQKNGWPYEAYSPLQGLWTQGRLTGVGTGVIWELG